MSGLRTIDPNERIRHRFETRAVVRQRNGRIYTASYESMLRHLIARAVEHGAVVKEEEGALVRVTPKWIANMFRAIPQYRRSMHSFPRDVLRSLSWHKNMVVLTRKQIVVIQRLANE
jgi:hypothetical protein